MAWKSRVISQDLSQLPAGKNFSLEPEEYQLFGTVIRQ
jgi:hypothetical protein